MQRLNRTILNGWFLIAIDGDTDVQSWKVTVVVFNVVSLGITARRNIPLNIALDEAGPASAIADHGAVRAAFEAPWVRLILARTMAATLGLIALAITLVVR